MELHVILSAAGEEEANDLLTQTRMIVSSHNADDLAHRLGIISLSCVDETVLHGISNFTGAYPLKTGLTAELDWRSVAGVAVHVQLLRIQTMTFLRLLKKKQIKTEEPLGDLEEEEAAEEGMAAEEAEFDDELLIVEQHELPGDLEEGEAAEDFVGEEDEGQTIPWCISRALRHPSYWQGFPSCLYLDVRGSYLLFKQVQYIYI